MGHRPASTAAQRASESVAVRYPLTRPYRLSLAAVARRCGLHPDLVRKFVALGLVDSARDSAGKLWFPASAPAAIARVQRLRTGLCLNYASVGVVLDLLDRIEALEAALRRANAALPQAGAPIGQPRSGPSWT
ncbi:chaperone modulator CbpM [Streptantibioticus ferralitis]|uniref:Chaperone modulator CbpM n=1 Tax=Streptantibioticus ferralitis TaxID=236510 RepID=A0ABT5Z4G3_9ACTN|nr:chaperone modulator CbpM [Streptantibioticus ferralitis]MDF2258451.1 chaperone modulator CbpM [Streptantibioticus ferralitis]